MTRIKQCIESAHFPFVLAVFLISPSIVWIFLDNHVWPWDQAWYGEISVNLYYNLTRNISEWPQAMMTAFGIKAPAIAWFGQFFVPLARVFGSIDRSLLIFVVATQFLTLVLIYKILLAAFKNDKTLAVLGSLIAASAPLFVGMGHQYFVESLQLFGVVLLLFIYTQRDIWNRYDTLIGLIFVTSLLMLTKITSPLYVILPGAIILHSIVYRGKEKFIAYFQKKERIVLHVLVLLFSFTVTGWYIINWSSIYQFMQSSSSGPTAELYGVSASFVKKLYFWLYSAQKSFFVPAVAYGTLFLLGIAVMKKLFSYGYEREFLKRAFSFPVVSLASLIIVFAVFSFQINEETRYLLPALPYLIVLICWSISTLSKKGVALIVAGCFVGQFVFVHSVAFGLAHQNDGESVSQWVTSIDSDSKKEEDIEAIVSVTCNPGSAGKINVIGVEWPWLNANSIEYYATQRKLKADIQCYYTSIGYAENDVDKALDRIKNVIKPPYFITVELRLLQNGDAFNRVSLSVTDFIEHAPSFIEEPQLRNGSIRIFRGTQLEK